MAIGVATALTAVIADRQRLFSATRFPKAALLLLILWGLACIAFFAFSVFNLVWSLIGEEKISRIGDRISIEATLGNIVLQRSELRIADIRRIHVEVMRYKIRGRPQQRYSVMFENDSETKALLKDRFQTIEQANAIVVALNRLIAPRNAE